MGRGNYSTAPRNPTKCCKARVTNLRVHYKNTRETVMALRGMTLRGAQRYLAQVLDHKAAIPFRRHTGGIGRAPQAKIYNTTQVRWPKKSVEAIQQLLSNAASNADAQGLNVEALKLTHLQCNRAPKQRRRTYRAHGRINPFMASPCHVEIIAEEQEEPVAKGTDAPASTVAATD